MKYFYHKKKKKNNKKRRKYHADILFEARSNNQIIEIQLQLFVTLYYFKEVPLTCLIVARNGKKTKGKNK